MERKCETGKIDNENPNKSKLIEKSDDHHLRKVSVKVQSPKRKKCQNKINVDNHTFSSESESDIEVEPAPPKKSRISLLAKSSNTSEINIQSDKELFEEIRAQSEIINEILKNRKENSLKLGSCDDDNCKEEIQKLDNENVSVKSQLKKFENYKNNTKILNSILLKELEKKKPHRVPDFKSPSSPRKTSDVISSTIDSHSRLGNSQKKMWY